eukprot:689213_1
MSAGVIWLPGKFKGKKVFVETANGEMLKQRGKVRMKYSQSTSAKIYSAIASNITFKRKHCDSPVSKSSTEPKVQPKKRKRALSQREKRLRAKEKFSATIQKIPPEAIICFTDGACRGNPGPCGAGAVVKLPSVAVHLESYRALGLHGTNNIGELTAVELALHLLDEAEASGRVRARAPVHVCTDSKYARGVLTEGWTAKKNVELIRRVQSVLAKRSLKNPIHFHYCPAHCGVPENERADALANQGVTDSVARESAGTQLKKRARNSSSLNLQAVSADRDGEAPQKRRKL